MAGFTNDIMNADNVNFSGSNPTVGQVTANGQLMIGSSSAPNIRINTLTEGNGISIINGNGTITIATNGSQVANTITGNDAIALHPTSGNWNIVGTSTNGIQTSGSASTLTIRMNSPYADGNFAFSRSASGSANTLTVSNTSNTASSNALQQVTVAGTSAGDPATTYTITGASNWTMGLDNSVAGDPFVMSNSTALGTSNYMSVVRSSGYTTFNNLGNNTLFRLDWINNDTGASADSSIVAGVIATSLTADPYIGVAIPSVSCYSWGIDNSDNDSLKITQDANNPTPSSAGVLWKMTSGGVRTLPLQPSFLANLSATQSNQTGDGTVYSVPFDTEVFDRGGNFALNTFTAPVSGLYQFNVSVTVANLSASSTDVLLNLVAGGTSYQLSSISGAKTFETQSGSNTLQCNGSVLVSMTAAQTATVNVAVFGGTKTVGVLGGLATRFSGFLVA